MFEINNFLESLDAIINVIDKSSDSKNDKIDDILDIYIPTIGNQYEIILESIAQTILRKSIMINSEELFLEFRSIITDDLRKKDFKFNSFYRKQCLKIKLKLQKELEKLKFNIV